MGIQHDPERGNTTCNNKRDIEGLQKPVVVKSKVGGRDAGGCNVKNDA
jgi:hypothetical protein